MNKQKALIFKDCRKKLEPTLSCFTRFFCFAVNQTIEIIRQGIDFCGGFRTLIRLPQHSNQTYSHTTIADDEKTRVRIRMNWDVSRKHFLFSFFLLCLLFAFYFDGPFFFFPTFVRVWTKKSSAMSTKVTIG